MNVRDDETVTIVAVRTKETDAAAAFVDTELLEYLAIGTDEIPEPLYDAWTVADMVLFSVDLRQ